MRRSSYQQVVRENQELRAEVRSLRRQLAAARKADAATQQENQTLRKRIAELISCGVDISWS